MTSVGKTIQVIVPSGKMRLLFVRKTLRFMRVHAVRHEFSKNERGML